MSIREVFFIRHAKSSWADSSLQDIERPLNKRGLRDGPFMAQKLREVRANIDVALISPAKRAMATFDFFSEEIEFKETRIDRRIYHAWPDQLIRILTELDEDVTSAVVFGHNPGFTDVYNTFAKAPISNLPTCGIFQLICSSTWDDMDTTNTESGHLLYPKMYVR